MSTYLSYPGTNQRYEQALYLPILPGDLAGATINAATFTVIESWNNGYTFNVNLSRINTVATWDPGTGKHTDRWGPPDDGIQRWWADWDNATTSGVRWDGTVAPTGSSWDSPTNPSFADTAIGALIDTQICDSGSTSVFNVLTLAQNWASGAWDNDGFVLQATSGFSTDGTLKLRTHIEEGGLFIDYTPVPEPALVGVLTAGSLVLLRQRRRTA